VTSLKANLEKKKARFLTKQILRDEIEGKKTKQIAIKRIKNKFNLKKQMKLNVKGKFK